jgi:hypothetical protein
MPTTRRSRAKRTRPAAGAECAVLTFSARTISGIGTSEPAAQHHKIRDEANLSTPTGRKYTNEFPDGHERTRPRPRHETNPARVDAAKMHKRIDARARPNPTTQPGGIAKRTRAPAGADGAAFVTGERSRGPVSSRQPLDLGLAHPWLAPAQIPTSIAKDRQLLLPREAGAVG